MNDIAVVVCNYNKCDFVVKCIESLLEQTIKDFDIYIVDNASTDGSVCTINKRFGTSVKLIQNEMNLGGSGGFNTGIRCVLERGYKYIILLDNDVILDANCISQLVVDMERNLEIGIMGAKILKMDYPDVIQEFGPIVNFETMTFELSHGGEKDSDILPHLQDCDYVPACALIVRKEIVEKIGCMPEENFIYYDDITWCVRAKYAGYRVVANSKAMVWHKGGAGINPTTFSNYYLTRNKTNFFLTYMNSDGVTQYSSEAIKERVNYVLSDIFQGIYSCIIDGRYNIAKTRMDAFLDALEGKSGKAESYKIRERENIVRKFERIIKKGNSILIYMNEQWENTRRIVFHIKLMMSELNKKIDIDIVDAYYAGQGLQGYIIHEVPTKKEGEYDVVFSVCKHVFEWKGERTNKILIDGWENVLYDVEDYDNYEKYSFLYNIFRLCFEDKVLEKINSNQVELLNRRK